MTPAPMIRALLAAALLACGSVGAFTLEEFQFQSPGQEQEFRELIGKLRCLVCQNQSLADSDAELAALLAEAAQERNEDPAILRQKVTSPGGTTEAALKKLLRDTSTDAKVVLFDDAEAGIEALRRKQIDAFSSDQVVLIGLALKETDPMNFAIRSEVFSFEPFALAVRRNDADFRLVADRVISELYRSGKILEIYDKWIGKFTRKRLPIFDAMVKLNATPE